MNVKDLYKRNHKSLVGNNNKKKERLTILSLDILTKGTIAAAFDQYVKPLKRATVKVKGCFFNQYATNCILKITNKNIKMHIYFILIIVYRFVTYDVSADALSCKVLSSDHFIFPICLILAFI